jgi:acetyl/propionyl-CoA carboxylase alpha subunit
MLAKLIAWGGDRSEAITRLRRALGEYYASGIKTNVSLIRRILATSDFQSGAIHTSWLDDFLREEKQNGRADSNLPARPGEALQAREAAAIFAAALWHRSQNGRIAGARAKGPDSRASRWKLEGRQEQVNREPDC